MQARILVLHLGIHMALQYMDHRKGRLNGFACLPQDLPTQALRELVAESKF